MREVNLYCLFNDRFHSLIFKQTTNWIATCHRTGHLKQLRDISVLTADLFGIAHMKSWFNLTFKIGRELSLFSIYGIDTRNKRLRANPDQIERTFKYVCIDEDYNTGYIIYDILKPFETFIRIFSERKHLSTCYLLMLLDLQRRIESIQGEFS